MIVVSDTSVVSVLIQIGRIHLLAEIFGEVVIPVAVADELAELHSGFRQSWKPESCAKLERLDGAGFMRPV
jgi:predicted nucleic acid-binding protein